MEGKGPRHERETVILFNEEDDTASIWTASEITYRKLKKLGYIPTKENERSATFEVTRASVRVARALKRHLSEAHKAALHEGLLRSRQLSIE